MNSHFIEKETERKANNLLKICLVSLVIKEMKIMSTESHNFTPTILGKL